MCKSGALCNMASFRLAIVHGVQLHCTRLPESREVLPAEQWSGQSTFSCRPHVSCSGPRHLRTKPVAAQGRHGSQKAGVTSQPRNQRLKFNFLWTVYIKHFITSAQDLDLEEAIIM